MKFPDVVELLYPLFYKVVDLFHESKLYWPPLLLVNRYISSGLTIGRSLQ
jgi:hypothetical protein